MTLISKCEMGKILTDAYAHTHTDTHTQRHTCTHTHTHRHTHAYTHIHTQTVQFFENSDNIFSRLSHLLWFLLPGFSPLDDGQQVLVLKEGFFPVGGGMFHLALWTLKGSAPSKQLDQTPLTEGVGAGKEPRYARTTVLILF